MAKSAKLELDGKTIELPIIEGTEGEKSLDITRLRGETGYITHDPGYANTGSCRSAITFIDGEKGILRYRGIPIEQLAEKSSFLEVAYLLIVGHLPKQDELDSFSTSIRRHNHDPRGLQALSRSVTQRCPPDGGLLCRSWSSGNLLPGLSGPPRSSPGRDFGAPMPSKDAHTSRLRV